MGHEKKQLRIGGFSHSFLCRVMLTNTNKVFTTDCYSISCM